jgi:hypothetical protein
MQAGEPWLFVWLEGVTGAEVFDAYANHLASYVSACSLAGDYLPCHISCEDTARRAHEGKEAAQWFGLADLVENATSYARRPVVVVGDDLIFLPSAALEVTDGFFRFPKGRLILHGPNARDWTTMLTGATDVKILADDVVFDSDKGGLWCGSQHSSEGRRLLFLQFTKSE